MRWIHVTILLLVGMALAAREVKATEPASAVVQRASSAGLGQQPGGKGMAMQAQGGGCKSGQGGKTTSQQQMLLTTGLTRQPGTTGFGLQQTGTGFNTQTGTTSATLRQGIPTSGMTSLQQGGLGSSTSTQQATVATGIQALHQSYALLTQMVGQLQKSQIQSDALQALQKDLQALKQSGQSNATLAQKTTAALQALQQALADLQILVNDPTLPTQTQAWLSSGLQSLQQLYQAAQQGGTALTSQTKNGGAAQ